MKSVVQYLIENRILRETPITDITHIGNFDKSYSIKKATDRAIVTNPVAVQKLNIKFSKTPHKFNFVFVNTKEGKEYTEHGMVTLNWLKENMPLTLDALVNKTNTSDFIFPQTDALNVIFTNNAASQHVPLTPWIIAHRIAHAINATFRNETYWSSSNPITNVGHMWTEVNDIIIRHAAQIFSIINYSQEYPLTYGEFRNGENINSFTNRRRNELAFKSLFTQLCTFRSARENNIREWFEVINELLAQYIITNNIKFNTINQPYIKILRSKYPINDYDREYINTTVLDDLKEELLLYFDSLLGYGAGRIFVM